MKTGNAFFFHSTDNGCYRLAKFQTVRMGSLGVKFAHRHVAIPLVIAWDGPDWSEELEQKRAIVEMQRVMRGVQWCPPFLVRSMSCQVRMPLEEARPGAHVGGRWIKMDREGLEGGGRCYALSTVDAVHEHEQQPKVASTHNVWN